MPIILPILPSLLYRKIFIFFSPPFRTIFTRHSRPPLVAALATPWHSPNHSGSFWAGRFRLFFVCSDFHKEDKDEEILFRRGFAFELRRFGDGYAGGAA